MVRRSSAAGALLVTAVTITCGACGTRSPLACEEELNPDVGGTLHFVVDRSTSMAQDGRWETMRSALADVMRSLDASVTVSVTLFPKPGVRGDGCAAGAIAVSPTVAGGGAAARAFLHETTALPPSGGTPTAKTLVELLPGLEQTRKKRSVYVVLATDGGPNCGEARGDCPLDQCTYNLEGTLERCPPTGPRNCCLEQGDGCLDVSATNEVLRAYRERDIPTYVVGVTDIRRLRAALDDMALAAGTASAAGGAYYPEGGEGLESVRALLVGVMREIATSCEIPLPVGAGEKNFRVELDGAHAVAGDGESGFTTEGTRMRLHGAACAARKSGAKLRIITRGQCER
jgi:hypothetical protein